MTRFGIFAVFTCTYFLVQLLRAVNAVVGPHLIATFDIGATELGVLTSVFFLGFALMQLPIGLMLDRFGPRTVQLTLLPLVVAGTLITWAAQSYPALVLGRALIGIGGAACLMSAFKVLAEWFPRERLAFTNGALMGIGGLGAVAAGAPLEWLLGRINGCARAAGEPGRPLECAAQCRRVRRRFWFSILHRPDARLVSRGLGADGV